MFWYSSMHSISGPNLLGLKSKHFTNDDWLNNIKKLIFTTSQPQERKASWWHNIIQKQTGIRDDSSTHLGHSGKDDRSSFLLLWIFSRWCPHLPTLGLGPPNPRLKEALKGLSHQIKFAWKWYDSLGLGKDMWRWTFKKFFTLPLILYCLLKFFCDPHKILTNLLS
jgi:hypothetical protein